MTDDLLTRAARALREETAGDDAAARFTRSRIMASVHDDRVKRRTRWAFVLPIAATFVAASAYGAATGKTRAAFEVVARAQGVNRPSRTESPPVSQRSRAPAASTQAVEPKAPAPVATGAEVSPPEPELASAPAAPAPAPEPTAPRAKLAAAAPPHNTLPGVGGAAADPIFDLYKAAHELHFVRHDDARALAAWDAYLKAAPRGALVPEARYNRALCLVRLHRNDEARAALEPFAAGHYGTYRREDAQKLLAALPAGPVVPLGP
jgi:TolA-binding protein